MDNLKRKKIVVSLEKKVQALKKLDSGSSIKQIAVEYGVGQATVVDWKRNRDKIEAWCRTKASTSTGHSRQARKTMKDSYHHEVSEALYILFCQQRDKGIPLSGPIVQAKALAFHKLQAHENDDFTASVGWLDRWKKRYGVRNLKISGEKLSADENGLADFQVKLKEIIKDESYLPEQIYNCDETGLYYKLLPSSTLASGRETSAPGYKKNKERLTLLACSNASGTHKIRLMCIGKSAKPRAFKHMNPNAFPVYYKNQKSSWMTSELFKEWFFKEYVPAVERFLTDSNLPRKALLVIDNAPCHSNIQELCSGDIKTIFLPPNVTSICQPMDQGVLEALKKKYKSKLLEKIISNESLAETSVISDLKKIDLKEVIYWIASAWDSILQTTLQKSWSKLLQGNVRENSEHTNTAPEDENLFTLAKNVPGCEAITEPEFTDWLTIENNEPDLSDTEIMNCVKEKTTLMEIEEEEEEEGFIEPKISHNDGFNALNKALEYIEQQDEANASDILLIRRWRDIASKKRTNSLKQQTITSFFK